MGIFFKCVYMIDYLYWFLNIEQFLHVWDELYLIMVNNLFDMCLIEFASIGIFSCCCCCYLINNFICLALWFWLSFSFSFTLHNIFYWFFGDYVSYTPITFASQFFPSHTSHPNLWPPLQPKIIQFLLSIYSLVCGHTISDLPLE